MKTTLVARLSAFSLSVTFATVATFGVALMMTESGDRSHLAAIQSAPIAMTLTPAPPAL